MYIFHMNDQVSLVTERGVTDLTGELFDAHVDYFNVRVEVLFLRKRSLALQTRVSASVHSLVSHH